MAARRFETGVISSIGEKPTILSDSDGSTVGFAYRNVKRAANEPRHTFVVGDRVEFRRKSRVNAISTCGLLISLENAKQVRLLVPTLLSTPSSESSSSPTAESVGHLSEALAVAKPVGDNVWRHDPYSTDKNQVTCVLPVA
eukprot:TRINITY_DN44298_c0_g1_i1.p1 TRINITY_DN44298_c0_g1~~TRINITY_DN44298_c0_g1_i1.p1  ORF type:complete len:141 (+),score=30.06 TRINITY_DN44298_c0_g1_i1:131-553(+)